MCTSRSFSRIFIQHEISFSRILKRFIQSFLSLEQRVLPNSDKKRRKTINIIT
jgi:hypothetical protein